MTALAEAMASVDLDHYIAEPDGRVLSQSSAPAIIEALIRLADVEPGMRVLEIGTGSGYSAALLAALVGQTGEVVSVEVDQVVADRARDKLTMVSGTTVVCGDGGQGAPDAAPFDRVIAWTTPRALPASWVRQTRDGGAIVSPVKVAPVALANLAVKATVADGVPGAVVLHEGSFVDMTPMAADQRVPSFYVDARADTGGEIPAWLSAPAVRDDVTSARALLDGIAHNPRVEARPTPPFPMLTAALAAARLEILATAFTGQTRGIGYATDTGIAVATPDGLASYGDATPFDMLAEDVRNAEKPLAEYAVTVEATVEGWSVRLAR